MIGRALSLIALAAPSQSITCYGVNGIAYKGQVLCPGSKACCGEGGTCMGNRLCHMPGDDQGTLIRGPCAEDPYDENECATICVYNETVYHENHFPRVKQCDNKSYCCSNDPDCCRENSGTFLDSEGNIVDESTSTSEPLSSPTIPASTTDTSSAETFAEPTPPPDDTVSDSSAFKVGLGLGIPLASIVAATGAWFLFKRTQAQSLPAMNETDISVVGHSYPQSQACSDDRPPVVEELFGTLKPAEPAELGAGDVARRER